MKYVTFAGVHENRFDAINEMKTDMSQYRRIGNKYPVVSQIEYAFLTCYFIQMWTLEDITDGFIIEDETAYMLCYVNDVNFKFNFSTSSYIILGSYTVIYGSKAQLVYQKLLNYAKDKPMMTLMDKVAFLKEYSNIIPKVSIK